MKQSLITILSLVLVSSLFIGCAAQTTTTTTTKRRELKTGSNLR